MKILIAAALVNAVTLVGFIALAIPTHAASTPACEDQLKEMRAAKSNAKLSVDDMAKVNDLEAKAVERCNADDDKRANKFTGDAMKLLAK